MEAPSTARNMFSNPNPSQQTNTEFGTWTVSQQSRQSSVNSPFGSTGHVFNTQPVSFKSLDKPQSNPASGAPSTNIFGVPRNLGCGFEPTPSIFHSNAAHGSASSVFGVPSVTSLAPETANNGLGTNNTMGSGFPSFGSTSSSVSSSLFGPQSSGGFFTTPFQNSSSSASTFLNSNINNMHGIHSSGSQGKVLPWAIGSTTRKQCKGSSVAPYSATRETNGASGENSLVKMQSISAMPVYSDKSHEELRMEDYELHNKGGNTSSQGGQSGFKHFDVNENIFSLPKAFKFSASNTLSNSPHFVTPAVTNSSAPTLTRPPNTFFTTSTSPSNTFSSDQQPFAFSPSIPSIFQPRSTVTSINPTFSPTPNPFSSLNPVTKSTTNDNCLPSLSTPFTSSPFSTFSSSEPSFTFRPFSTSQPLSSLTSSTTASTLSINPFSSLNLVNKSISSNNCEFPKSSAVQTFPSSSETLFTFSPSILSALEKTLGPFPPFLNASQRGQAVPKVNFSFTTNHNESSLAETASTKVPAVDSQNVNVQQFVSSSTVSEQLSCIQNPFGPQVEVNISNCQPHSRISIQTGISSLSVLDNPSPVRKAPLLRIRHWSSRQNRYPAQGLTSVNKELKVPFSNDTEHKPCAIAPLMPRMNPRSWVSNSSYVVKNTPRDNGAQGSENKVFATSSDQPEGTSPETTTHEVSIQEDNFDRLLPLLPKLRLGDYYTEPPISLLAENERAAPGFCSHVPDFVFGRRGYGSIKFLGETDVRSLDLESIVQFNKREVIVYLKDLDKPPVGQGLNKPAEVTLLDVKCIDKKTGIQYTDGENVQRYRAMLIKKAKEIGAEFISYDPVEGAWKFRVQHF